ncbi:uncharacterized protein LOC133711112 [Rosa rugosa]|uniref:uncharacterized protein LOC133711112 n=1 Tax=Rosa rugosa TaxID=74645 RepID=UPI002B4111E8|nr:uncharacterized protein LOC133711112 [Rosa rugosa]
MDGKAAICPWSLLDVDTLNLPRSYASVVAKPVVSVDDLPTPEIHEGKTTVTISEEGYRQGLERCKHMLLERLHLASGEKPYSPTDLHKKLSLVWGEIGPWRVIPIGKGYFTFIFSSEEVLSMVWGKGAIALKPGILRFMRWTPNFSPSNQRNTNAQVWVRLWDLGLEFWEPITLFEISNGIGVPVKVDPSTLDRKFGLYARVLVDIDLSSNPPGELTVRRKTGEVVVVEVEYERLPDFCYHCGNVGHRVSSCNLVQKSTNSMQLEETEGARGRSRKPRRRRRKTQQVYVQKQQEKPDNGNQVIVDNTPPPVMDDPGEGPSFARKSPLPNPIATHRMGNAIGTDGNMDLAVEVEHSAPSIEQPVEPVTREIQNVNLQILVASMPLIEKVRPNREEELDDSSEDDRAQNVNGEDEVVPENSKVVASSQISHWYEETERVEEEEEFTTVVSNA